MVLVKMVLMEVVLLLTFTLTTPRHQFNKVRNRVVERWLRMFERGG
jgi:hypothetical protein